MKANVQKTLIAAVVAGASTASGVVNAQLEEVIVTAERREASIQDTPISMQALTADQIEKRGIVNLSDLFVSAAGVSGYEAPSSRGNMSLNIRGSVPVTQTARLPTRRLACTLTGYSSAKGLLTASTRSTSNGSKFSAVPRHAVRPKLDRWCRKLRNEEAVQRGWRHVQASLGDYGYRAVKAASMRRWATLWLSQRRFISVSVTISTTTPTRKWVDSKTWTGMATVWRRAGCRPIA